ncbi:M23 family metallopeptidase [Kaarinaea lacus]
MNNSEIIIHPPVKGSWAIYNPPGHPRLAFDLLAEDEKQSLYAKHSFARHMFTFISVEDTYTWTSPVYSPVDGVVVQSHDTESDRKKISFVYDLFSLLIKKPEVSQGFGAFGGNHIMIEFDGHYLLLCHLKQGSASVKKGDSVKVGQKIAEVGNSGSSIQPHLHVQVMSNDQYFPLFENLVPFKICAGKVKEHNNWKDEKNIQLASGSHYLFDG